MIKTRNQDLWIHTIEPDNDITAGSVDSVETSKKYEHTHPQLEHSIQPNHNNLTKTSRDSTQTTTKQPT